MDNSDSNKESMKSNESNSVSHNGQADSRKSIRTFLIQDKGNMDYNSTRYLNQHRNEVASATNWNVDSNCWNEVGAGNHILPHMNGNSEFVFKTERKLSYSHFGEISLRCWGLARYKCSQTRIFGKVFKVR